MQVSDTNAWLSDNQDLQVTRTLGLVRAAIPAMTKCKVGKGSAPVKVGRQNGGEGQNKL